MITKLEAGKKYKIIDKEGYYRSSHNNSWFFEEYAIDGCFIGNKVDGFGSLWRDGHMLIGKAEAKFFELVEEEEVLTLDTELSFTATCKDWLLVYCLLANVVQERGGYLFNEVGDKLKIPNQVNDIILDTNHDVWLRDTSSVEEAWLKSFKNDNALSEKRKQIEKLQKEIKELENN